MLPALLGGIGVVGGALGGGALAGRYMPIVAKQALRASQKGKKQLSEKLLGAAAKMDRYGAGGPGAIGAMATDVQDLLRKGADAAANIPATPLVRGGAITGNLAAASLGGILGGQALGGIGNALMPQQPALDPESYGSSNLGSMGTPTMRYV